MSPEIAMPLVIWLLLTTSAVGDILPVLYLCPGEPSEIANVPTEAFDGDDENYHKVAPAAFMDELTFQQWIYLFVSVWLPKYRRDPKEYALLLVDGHSSHLNVSTLLTAACNRVIILCFPSHLTHILQPNDDSFNRISFPQSSPKWLKSLNHSRWEMLLLSVLIPSSQRTSLNLLWKPILWEDGEKNGALYQKWLSEEESVQVGTVLVMIQTEEHLDKLRKRKEEKEKRAEK